MHGAFATVGEQLYAKVKADVTASTPQTPQYGVISSAGYDPGADYLIRQRPAQVSQKYNIYDNLTTKSNQHTFTRY